MGASKQVGQKGRVGDRASDALFVAAYKRASSVRASIVAFDEMWTYLEIRRGERRQDLWIWTSVVEERDGIRWRMYEVGGQGRICVLALVGSVAGR